MTDETPTALEDAKPLMRGTDQRALAFVLATLGRPTRLQIVQWLSLRGPLTTRGLSEFIPQTDLTQHLLALERGGMIYRAGLESKRVVWDVQPRAVLRVAHLLTFENYRLTSRGQR